MLRAVLGVLFLTFALGARGDTTRLRVALFDVPPYAFSADGAMSGLYVDWMREFLAGLGIEADFELMPFPRIPLALESRQTDLTIGFATEALDKAASPLGTVLRVESLVITRGGLAVKDIAGLQGALIGRARGGCQDLTRHEELRLRWAEVVGFDKGLRMLELQRLDGLCLTRDVLRHYLPQLGIDRARLGSEIVVSQRIALLYARTSLDAALRAKLQAALARRAPLQRD